MNRQALIRTLSTKLVLFSVVIGGWFTGITFAQSDPEQAPLANQQIFLPLITSGKGADAPPTATPTATRPATTPPATLQPQTPTPTVTPIPPARNLPVALVGTWFSGNAPLNDFYNPQTGEWRDVSGLGQMYVFGADGAYTYTGFLRIQNGACRSEVSTFKQGVAESNGGILVLHPNHTRTRTMIVCPTPKESITEGSQEPINADWSIGTDDAGHEKLNINEGGSATQYAKLGMAAVLVGTWHSAELTSANFYDPATDTFNLNSPTGMWFTFTADGAYAYGEHDQSEPNAQGCVLTGWVYQTGTLAVSGSTLTPKPTAGVLRLENSCKPDQPSQTQWLDAARTYVWSLRDRTTAVKLVLIPLERYVEFVFQPE